MTPEEAQKRLTAVLERFGDLGVTWYGGIDEGVEEAKQALSELFRDVIGEVITATQDIYLTKYQVAIGDYGGDVARHWDMLRDKQKVTAARYFPVDGGGEK